MPSPISRQAAANFRRSALGATFVFLGHIERAETQVPEAGGRRGDVVRVDRILKAPDLLSEFAGQQVIVVADAEAEDAGRTSGVFFTSPIAFGEMVALRGIGRVAEAADPDALAELIRESEAEVADETLRAQLRGADVVVHGRILEVKAAPTESEPLSEHSPEWRVARVQVETALKGEAKGVILVRFPGSTDVRWYATPKLREGEEAILLLHRDGLRFGDAELAVLYPGDVAPASSEEIERRRRHL